MLGRSKPARMSAALRDAELAGDVVAGALVGGGGQREARHLRKSLEQRQQQPVIGPEIMAPFADAMRLVDRDQRQRDARDQAAEALARRTLRRDVEEVEIAGAQALDRLGAVVVGRGQGRGADPERLGGADLVVHQRDQRRDDERGSFPRQRRHLVAERLARPGRHHRQRVLARHDAVDHLLLDPAEGGEAEGGVEDFERGEHLRTDSVRWWLAQASGRCGSRDCA